MQKTARQLLPLLLFLFGQMSKAQPLEITEQLFVERLNNANGLPSEFVYKIFQDSKQNLWFCTNNGLTKYNGYYYTHFRHNPSDSQSLAANWVESITEDPNGRLWIGTAGGLCYFKPTENKFILIKDNPPKHATVIRKDVTASFYDKLSQSVLYADVYGIRIFNLKSGERSFIDYFGKSDDYHKITFFYRDSKKRLWFMALHNGLGWLDTKTNQISNLVFKDKHGQEKFIQPILIQEDKHGILWINTWGDGLVRVDSISYKNEIFYTSFLWYKSKEPDYSHNIVSKCDFYTDANGNEKIYLATEDNGLGLLDIETKKFTFYKNIPNSSFSLNHNSVTNILITDNILWAATHQGIAKIDFYKQRFHKNIFPTDDYSESVDNSLSKIHDIVKDELQNHIFWGVSHLGVIAKIDQTNNTIEYFYPPPHLGKTPFRYTNALLFTNPNTLMIGHSGGIVFFNTKTKLFDLKTHNPQKGWPYQATHFTRINANEILIISYNEGAFIYNHTSQNITPFLNDRISENRMNSCTKLKNGDLVFCMMQSGIFWYKKNSNKLIHYNDREKGKFNFPFPGGYNCVEDDEGNLWCTSSFGLVLFNNKTGRFNIFKSKENWTADWTIKACKDNKNNIWVLTKTGLVKINAFTKTVQFFKQKEGMDNLNVYHLSMSDDSNIFVSGQNLFYAINPLKFKNNTKIPVIKLYDFWINGTPETISKDQFIKLEHNQNSIQLRFFLSNFYSPLDVDFKITLVEKGSKPVYFTEPVINLSFLEPGQYSLIVNAKDKNGEWQCKPLIYDIKIKQPWFKTWWFIILLAFGLITGSLALYQIRLKKQRKQQAAKQEIENTLRQMEMKTLRAQMNPHFIFNSLNSIQKYILSNESLKASDYLGRFSRMIRLVLENSIEANTTLEMEQELLRNYLELEQLRCNDKFSFEINIDIDLDPELRLPSMLAQPYLENSIWHGIGLKETKGHITVSYSKQPYGVDCVIADDGIGRQKSMALKAERKHKSLGLNLTEQRLRLLNPDLNESVIISDLLTAKDEICGTQVIIKIHLLNP